MATPLVAGEVLFVMRALLIVAVLSFSAVAAVPGHAGTTDGPELARPPVVIGIYDSGINPYHEAFRAPTWTAHPSAYIPGYPDDARPLHLTFDAESYDEAVAADLDVWLSVEPYQLYYIPGTRIVGAMDLIANPSSFSIPILDHSGHGTAVADSAVGNWLGPAKDAAIVMTKIGFARSVEYFASQPWVDLITDSHGGLVYPPPVESAPHWTKVVTDQGRIVIEAGGNGPYYPNIVDSYDGPSWIFVIGGFRGDGSETRPYTICNGCNRPFELAARHQVEAADWKSINGTVAVSGTSFAAPTMAGYTSLLIDAARQRLGHEAGFQEGAYARLGPGVIPPVQGPLADGELTRPELQHIMRQVSEPLPYRPSSIYPPPLSMAVPSEASYSYQGYGMFSEPHFERALDVLLGEATLDPRPVDDEWHAFYDGVADAYWEKWLCVYYAANAEVEC